MMERVLDVPSQEVITKYIDALQAIGSSKNQKVLFLPMEATNLIGSIGGISELIKESFKSSFKNDNPAES